MRPEQPQDGFAAKALGGNTMQPAKTFACGALTYTVPTHARDFDSRILHVYDEPHERGQPWQRRTAWSFRNAGASINSERRIETRVRVGGDWQDWTVQHSTWIGLSLAEARAIATGADSVWVSDVSAAEEIV
jgi:hypothetical protein